MEWTDNLTALNQILPGFYSNDQAIRRVLSAAGVPVAFVNLTGNPMDAWYSALVEAERRGKVPSIVRAALADYPEDKTLLRGLEGALSPEIGPEPEESTWQSEFEPGETERLMEAQSTLLPVSFLERGTQVARSVALLRATTGSGTGFLTTDNHLVTNNHVLPSADVARSASIVFNFELTSTGGDVEGEPFELDPDAFFDTSPQGRHDWTIVAARGKPASKYGGLSLVPDVSPLDDELRWVNIVQHPLGGPKAIALYHNLVTYKDDDYLLYMTDTQPGSSGSPVFDSEWRLVALHRGFKYVRDPGKWRRRVFRNWGTNIQKVAHREH